MFCLSLLKFQLQQILAKTGNRFRSFAEGGVLDEPVLGVGQNTGDIFSLAERGPELVTSQGKVGKTGNTIHLHTTITGNNINSEMDLNNVSAQINNKIINMLTALGVV